MDIQAGHYVEKNWSELVQFLPSGWQEKARELKAFTRNRAFPNPEILLRVLLMHFATGYSLRVTAAMAREAHLATLSDVALLKRLNKSGDWFLWMAQKLRELWSSHKSAQHEEWEEQRIRAVDATTVQEPCASGTTWRIHYALSLGSLHCEEVYVTSPGKGESFKNFQVSQNDIFIADRAYATPGGIHYVLGNKGNIIVRYISSLPVYDTKKERMNLLDSLKDIKIGDCREFPVNILFEKKAIPLRLCVIKKSEVSASLSKEKILKEARKKNRKVLPETLDFAEYVMVLTSLEKSILYPEFWKYTGSVGR